MVKYITKEIEIALAACQKAWADVPNAKFAWCCHHGIELERLTQPAQGRIYYIVRFKPSDEQEARLNNFRPVISQLPADYDKASADYDKASADYNKAWADYNKARADYYKARSVDYNKARADYYKAEADLEKARVDYGKARTDYKARANLDKEEISRLHKLDVPNHTWNGVDIF